MIGGVRKKSFRTPYVFWEANLSMLNTTRRSQLIDELRRIEDILRREYHPDKVILFGSLAESKVTEWSDLDIAIIKETDKPFLQRLREVRRLVKPRVATDILVYTNDELAANADNYFIAEILRKGRVILMKKEEQIDKWLEFAHEDLRSAEILFREKIYNKVCFFAQQCVEKCLKAFILKEKGTIPKIHSLSELYEIVNGFDDVLSDYQDELIELDDYYIPMRYPDAILGNLPEGLPDENDAKGVLKIAKKIYKIILDKRKEGMEEGTQ